MPLSKGERATGGTHRDIAQAQGSCDAGEPGERECASGASDDGSLGGAVVSVLAIAVGRVEEEAEARPAESGGGQAGEDEVDDEAIERVVGGDVAEGLV